MVMDSAMEAKLSAFSSRVLSLAKKRSDETDEKTNEIRKAKTEKKQDEFWRMRTAQFRAA